jgi:DNA adenine methylase
VPPSFPQDSGSSPEQVRRPFLRWAGGKRWLTSVIGDITPREGRRYFEPFLGAGAIYFSRAPESALLSDRNKELIDTFQVVRSRPSELIESLREFSYTRAEYERVRAETSKDRLEGAARFIFLNRTCWNGLYRVNRKGVFNVPFGRPYQQRRSDEDAISRASELLQGASLYARDFELSLAEVRSGDFVFLDPPYTVTHGENGFLLYNRRIFSWADQLRLKTALTRLDKVGALFLLTDADHSSIRSLYSGFRMRSIQRSSIIAGDPAARRGVSELLVSNYDFDFRAPRKDPVPN